MKSKLILVLFVAIIIMTVALLDMTFNNSLIVNNILYRKECAYEVPTGYSIYYSREQKKYAVRVLQYGDYYLYDGKYGIGPMFSNIAGPALFYDSCTAKAYLKAYIDKIRPAFK